MSRIILIWLVELRKVIFGKVVFRVRYELFRLGVEEIKILN